MMTKRFRYCPSLLLPAALAIAVLLPATGGWAQAPGTAGAADGMQAAPTQPAAPVERHSPSGPPPAGDAPPPGAGQGDVRGPMGPRSFHHGSRGDHTTTEQGFHRPGEFGFPGVPPGMWWHSTTVVQRLSLTGDQTKKMDTIFQHSRLQLIDLRANLERQNALLEPMLSANRVDQVKAGAQIDKVASARAELEKADAKMLLGLRAVLTPAQWTELQSHNPRGPGSSGRMGDRSPGPAHGAPDGMAGRGPMQHPGEQ